MDHLQDPNWWWEYALDGIVGGIIGGLMTGLAVWLTLRHERRQAYALSIDAAAAETATAGVELLRIMEHRALGDPRELRGAQARFTTALTQLQFRTARSFAWFTARLRAFDEQTLEDLAAGRLSGTEDEWRQGEATVAGVVTLAHVWLSDSRRARHSRVIDEMAWSRRAMDDEYRRRGALSASKSAARNPQTD